MLEIKNLTKIYRTKEASDFTALDNVSVSFNSTGMVFLLGKSGSGKSTLLNVLGGLDKFDKGEIIIQGKSSKDFSQRDFDSYRNTYLGFVFQEYNVLPEFTVYKNIALALELQGKKVTKEAVMSLLDSVDLAGLAKRKPNQLSGGQKQRIAIARALIKEPRIILADEPTGALDSATGKQVFDTLKKLSKDKLVIVVSHDREFAEEYADRIIELKDGKIISDVTKRKVPPKDLSSSVRLIGENILHIKKGHKLSEKETNLINELLETTDDGIYLSADEKVNKDLRKSARIDDLGNNEYFDKTGEDDKDKTVYNAKDLKLIKSHVKFKDSFKMGVSSLKNKKIRLFFTILLSAVALTLFGLADTMASFNVARCSYESLQNIGISTVSIEKQETISYSDGYSYRSSILGSNSDLKYLQETYKDHKFVPVYDWNFKISSNGDTYSYYQSDATGVANVKQNELENFGLKLVKGRMPNSSALDEIAITKYQLEVIEEKGLDGTTDKINENNIIGKKMTNSGRELTIVGVVDTDFKSDNYGLLKEENAKNSNDFYMLLYKFQDYINSGFHNVIFMSEAMEEYANKIVKVTNDVYCYDDEDSGSFYFKIGTLETSNSFFSADGDNILPGVVFFDENKTTLASDEVIVSSQSYINGSDNLYGSKGGDGDYYLYGTNTYYNNVNDFKTAVRNYANENYYNLKVEITPGTKVFGEYKVVGVYYDCIYSAFGYYSGSCVCFFKNIESAPKEFQGSFGNLVIINADAKDDADMIMALSKYDDVNSKYLLKNEISTVLGNFCDIIITLSQVFLYASIGFAVFSALLLMNFISVSISYKKKEIGILRALGARGSDVYGIFFNESFVITLINFIVGLCLTIGGVILINNLVLSGMALNIKLLSFGIRQIGLMLGVSLLVALVATFLPTHKISKMEPIDAIQERK